VSQETRKAQLKLVGGTALFPALAAAVEHFGEEAGLDESAQHNMVAACEQVCGDALRRSEDEECALDLTIEQLPDRLEIGIAYPGIIGPAIGLDAFIGSASAPNGSTGASLLTRVDRVRYETIGQTSRMILVKYLPGAKVRAN